MTSCIKHRRELHKLVDSPGAVVEIGVAEGRFSLEIAQWPNVTKLYLVDRWLCVPDQAGDGSMFQSWHDQNLQGVKDRLRPFKDKTTILRGDSVEMAQYVEDESLALVYIDGDHSYAGVRRDILAWAPKVRLGGCMAFHDFENPAYGVRVAVEEYARQINAKVFSIPEDNYLDAGAYFVC